ncbi:expressed unknown protein [Seminavis robusta]|uniref:Uncharacterized protein n=1 Tax=Seminavis robusta TaxID=568900 RepID=A0A9N8H5M7_9STRA|nr:expressed unknown protein [Seminavis robusta]|eukprot:Sro90_g047310.1 n/a (119) ;mRNA; f:37945-38301
MSIPQYIFVPTPWVILQESGDLAPAIPLRIHTAQEGSELSRWSVDGARHKSVNSFALPPTYPVRQREKSKSSQPSDDAPLNPSPSESHGALLDIPPRQEPSRRHIAGRSENSNQSKKK